MIKRSHILVFAACLCAAIAYLVSCGMTISQPPGSTIQGISVCSSAPTNGDIFLSTGSQYCGTQTLGGVYTLTNNLNVHAPINVAVPSAESGLNMEVSGDTDDRYRIVPGTGLQVGNGTAAPATVIDEATNLSVNNITLTNGEGGQIQSDSNGDIVFTNAAGTGTYAKFLVNGSIQPSTGITWGGGADVTELNAPRSTWSAYNAATTPTGALFGYYVPSVGITIRAGSGSVDVAAIGCAINPFIAPYVNGTEETGCGISLANGATQFANAGTCDVSVAAGTPVYFQIVDVGTSCTTQPSQLNMTIEYTTN